MEGENVILEEILHKIHEIKIGDYVDASDFLLKILSPTNPGEQDLLEDLRAGFRNRVIEPCFSKLEDIFQDLEKRHQSKDSQIYQLMDPLKSSDFQKYQQQVAKVLDQNLKTLKYPTASPIVSKILADPLNLVELSGLYQKKAKAVFDKQLDGLNTTIELPKDSVQSAADTVSLGKNAKDVVPVAKNPIVNSSLENIPAEKQQADLNANNSWSIGAANNLLEKPVKEKQQANLEAEAIEVTLSEKSLKDLKELLFDVGGKSKYDAPVASSDKSADNGSGIGLGEIGMAAALLPLLRILGKAALVGAVAAGAYEVGQVIGEYIVQKNKEADENRHTEQSARENLSWKGGRPIGKPTDDFITQYKDFNFEANALAIKIAKAQAGLDLSRGNIYDWQNQKNEISNLEIWRENAIASRDPNNKITKRTLEKRAQENFAGAKTTKSAETNTFQDNIHLDSADDFPIKHPKTKQTATIEEIDAQSLQDKSPKYLPDPLPVPNNPQAQINLNGYKLQPIIESPSSDTLISKVDMGDMTKQFHQVLSPLFNKMHDVLMSINDNTTGSGDNIVNNISSTDNSSSGNSGPMQSGRDPIADFRANYWRDSSSSTRYTS